MKVSSLECKCVFYRPEHIAKWGSHGTEFWRPCNNEIHQQIELEEQMKKMGLFV